MQITIPNEWTPRLHQLPVWQYFQTDRNNPNAIKRASLVWHRRAGKDSLAINLIATEAMQTVGSYWHMFPTSAHARRTIWNGIDGKSRRIIDQAFPSQIVETTRDNEMFIRLVNGSTVQFVGSDNYDSLVGANTRGIVFSEFALADPRAWDYFRPILMENGGWALFISTPRGRNHFYTLHNNAPDTWFTQRLTVDDTRRENGDRIFTDAMMAEERASGMSEEMIQQEYYCSWEGGLEGAYFTREINELRLNRFGNFEPRPYTLAMSVWDIGVADDTVIGIFHALPNGDPVLTDTIIDRNRGLDSYVSQLRNTPYAFAEHYAPHDIEQREYTTGKSRKELAEKMGLYFAVTPNYTLHDGIEQARAFLRRLHVNDTENNRTVLDYLAGYRREFDAKNSIFRDKPVHDYTSHAADMIRYAAIDYDAAILDREQLNKTLKVKRAYQHGR